MVLASRSVDDILCSPLDAYNESLEDDTDDVVACLCKRVAFARPYLERAPELTPGGPGRAGDAGAIE